MSEKTTPVARMEAVGRNPGNADETQTPDSTSFHPGYGAEEAQVPKKPLVELADINPPVSLSGLMPESEVSFIPMADASENGQWVNRQARRLKDVRSGYTAFQDGDVLFAKITPCMENGKGCHATRLKNGVGFGSTEFHVLRTREGQSQRYVYHWTRSDELRRKAEAMMTGSAGQRRVPADFFSRFFVFSPKVTEQHRIAEILDTLDDAIQKTEQLINKLKQIKQGLLHDLLTRGIDENGQLRDPIAHPEQFKDSVLGRIPREWCVKALVELAEIRSGIAKNSKKAVQSPIDVHYLRVANVQDGYLDLSEMSKITISKGDLERYEVLPGDVLMNEGGDLDKLGRGALWNGEYKPCIHQNHVFVIRCNKGLLPTYLDIWTGSQPARRYFLVAGKQTTNLASINKTALGQVPVAVPPDDEQARIVDTVSAMDARIDRELTALGKYEKIKKALMHDLLTGKVRVTFMSGEQYV